MQDNSWVSGVVPDNLAGLEEAGKSKGEGRLENSAVPNQEIVEGVEGEDEVSK